MASCQFPFCCRLKQSSVAWEDQPVFPGFEDRTLRTKMAPPAPPKPAPVFLIADLLLSAILLVTILSLYFLVTPFKRGFYCSDETIRYPYTEPTLNQYAVVVCLLGIPIAIFIIIELATSEGSELLFGKVNLPNGVLRAFDVISTYLFGAGVSEITSDSAKYVVGRLRPHFLDLCKPDVKCDAAAIAEGSYIIDYECTADVTKVLLDESRLSFPSGFSAFAFYAAVYTVIYLQYNYKWNSAKVIRHLIQFAIVMAAWFMALSRISDFHAHWSDVLAGICTGTLSAILTVFCVSDLKENSKVKREQMELIAKLELEAKVELEAKLAAKTSEVKHAPSDANAIVVEECP